MPESTIRPSPAADGTAARRLTRRGALKGVGAAMIAPLLGTLGPAAAVARQAPSLSVTALGRRLQSRYATNRSVRLHYEITGSGPLILFVHGFPAWWWTWRHIMAPLADRYTVAAMDTRGYNLSDKPTGVGNYDPLVLAGDVRAVIEHAGHRSATLVGHDWGGALSWVLAFADPQVVDRLVILNMPHHGRWRGNLRTIRGSVRHRATSGSCASRMRSRARCLPNWAADPSLPRTSPDS